MYQDLALIFSIDQRNCVLIYKMIEICYWYHICGNYLRGLTMLVFLWLGQGVRWQGAGGELIAWQVEPRAMEESEWQELLLL